MGRAMPEHPLPWWLHLGPGTWETCNVLVCAMHHSWCSMPRSGVATLALGAPVQPGRDASVS
jgi:hypothetical protein